MDSERWQQINALLDVLLELPPEERLAHLNEACPDDAALRQEVLSILEASGDADTFLESPARDYAATLLELSNDEITDPLIGKVVDGYRINDVLGRGGMGIVYQAEDEALSRTVALKMIDPALARDQAFVRRFQSEARALARIDSKYIVGVHAMRQTDSGLFIVMEYVEGGTVTDLISEGQVPWQKAIPIISEMLTALEHAHNVGIIHRDIKPSNIMLSQEGRVKVTDFGLAKQNQKDGMATVTQGISGTLYYMSPEQVKGLSDLDHRTDLYSMGMTIYQMLCGTLPLDRASGEFEVMRSIVEEKLPPPTEYNASIPKVVSNVVMKALEKNRDKRYQSAVEMRLAFESLLQPNVDDATIQLGDGNKEGDKKRVPYLWFGIAALAIIGIVIGYIVMTGPKEALPVSVAVNTEPSNAIVYIDGQLLGRSPIAEQQLDDGTTEVQVRLLKAGFVTLDTLIQLSDPSSTLQLTLQAESAPVVDMARVLLTSSVGNAHVLINGQEQGVTSSDGSFGTVDVEPGRVNVEVRLEGYKVWTEVKELAVGETWEPLATLEREEEDDPDPDPVPANATVTVHVQPDGGSITVEGESCREGQACSISPGLKKMTIRHPKYNDVTRDFPVEAGKFYVNTFYFEQKVIVQVRKEDGSTIWGSIRVDGDEVGQAADKPLSLGPGQHRIGVRRNGYAVVKIEKDGETVSTNPVSVRIRPSFKETTERIVFYIRPQ